MKTLLKWSVLSVGGFVGGYFLMLLIVGGPELVSQRIRDLKPKPKKISEQIDPEWAEEIRVRNKKERIRKQWDAEIAGDSRYDQYREQPAAGGGTGATPPGASGVNQQMLDAYNAAGKGSGRNDDGPMPDQYEENQE